jgi:DNA-binding PadR family transcriptional regulator
MSAIAVPPDRSTLSNTAAAVLGMIALGARSGYEIRRAAELSVRFFWALGPPQVYAQLKALEAEGLIAGRDEARGERPRRHFTLTDEGHQALRSWVTDPAGTGAMELRDPELLRLFFADVVDHDAARARIGQMRRRSQEALATFDREILPAAARAGAAGSHFPGHVAQFGRELHEFIAAWCDRVEQTLDADEPRRS